MGRPLKFKTVKELKKKINAYFNSIIEDRYIYIPKFEKGKEVLNEGEWIKELDRNKNPIKIYIEPPTITGLALYLETTRETLLDYEARDDFSDTIKEAKQLIEKSYEERLIKRGNSGDIFALKNFGWNDKSEVDLSSGGYTLADFLNGKITKKNNSNDD